MVQPCKCGSGDAFDICCKPFFDGTAVAQSPEQLVRSRFTAFARGNQGAYLLNTGFPATEKGLAEIELSNVSRRWNRLEIVGWGVQGDDGWAELNAHFTDLSDATVARVMHEKSIFTRIDGRWLYIGGEVVNG